MAQAPRDVPGDRVTIQSPAPAPASASAPETPKPTAAVRPWQRQAAFWESTSSWWGILALLLIWEVVGRIADLVWLPPVTEVIATLWQLFAEGVIQPHLGASLWSLAVGFAFSLVVGLIIGTLMGLSTTINSALDIFVNAMLFTPALIFAPILFAVFGLSDVTRISVVVLYAMFIIIINTAEGVRNVDEPLLDMAASFGASRFTAVRRIILPSAYPLIIAGLRLGAGRAVKGMINGEMFIALIGLGGLSASYGKSLQFPEVWAMALFIMIVAIVINQVVSLIERKLTAWYD